MPSTVTRRELLVASGGAGVSVIAGCSSIRSSDGSSPKLGEVYIENRHTTPGEIEVRITHDGDHIHASTHELEGAEEQGGARDVPGEFLDQRIWEDADGPLTIEASLTGSDEWVDADLSNFDSDGCVSYIVKRLDEDSIGIYHTQRCEHEHRGTSPYQ